MNGLNLRQSALTLVLVSQALIAEAPADATTQPLHGHMAVFNYLIGGTWLCSVKTPYNFPTPGDTFFLTFDATDEYTLHERRSPARNADSGYVFDGYVSYYPAREVYSLAMADSGGNVELLQSRDGADYSGRGWWQNQSYVFTHRIYEEKSANLFTVHEISNTNGPNSIRDYSCTRQLATSPSSIP